MHQVTIRCYGPLNDFLPRGQRQAPVVITFAGRRSIKDAVESLGVPHPEIELAVLNSEPASLDAIVRDGDRIAVFPRFYTLDLTGVAPAARPRPEPIRFALDGHLGKLARRLRLLGLDAACPAGASDEALTAAAAREGRILLTRDRELLKRRAVALGGFVRATDPDAQLAEVLHRYGPLALDPFSRCLRCNGELQEIPASAVEARLPPRTRRHGQAYRICRQCEQVYWRGAHWPRLQALVDAAVTTSPPRAGG
jgi:uncharacterized protein with PIN domain/sulfur carrier protein ThiS